MASTITIEGNTNETNLIISSESGQISDGTGTAPAAVAAATTAGAAAGTMAGAAAGTMAGAAAGLETLTTIITACTRPIQYTVPGMENLSSNMLINITENKLTFHELSGTPENVAASFNSTTEQFDLCGNAAWINPVDGQYPLNIVTSSPFAVKAEEDLEGTGATMYPAASWGTILYLMNAITNLDPSSANPLYGYGMTPDFLLGLFNLIGVTSDPSGSDLPLIVGTAQTIHVPNPLVNAMQFIGTQNIVTNTIDEVTVKNITLKSEVLFRGFIALSATMFQTMSFDHNTVPVGTGADAVYTFDVTFTVQGLKRQVALIPGVVAYSDAAAATAAVEREIAIALHATYLPDLNNSSNAQGFANGLNVKVLGTGLGKLRNLIVNKHNDIITVDQTTGNVLLFRPGDYTSSNYTELGPSDAHVLLRAADLNNDFPGRIDYVKSSLLHLEHGLACRSYNGVTKIFISDPDHVFCYTYDDSTLELANTTKLTDGKLLVKNMVQGLFADDLYYKMDHYHSTRELCFNEAGDLHIGLGSFSNVDFDPSGAMTDHRSGVMYMDALDVSAAANGSVAVTQYQDLTLLARGLRNPIGMALDVSNEIWSCQAGPDSLDVSGLGITDNALLTASGEVFSDYHPGEVVYKLSRDSSGVKYGFPYAWNNGRDVSFNGATVEENNTFVWPDHQTVEPWWWADNMSYTFPVVDVTNPVAQNDLSDAAVFKQHADVLLPAHSTPIAMTMNQADSNGKLIYDGKCDQTIIKDKKIDGEFCICTLKGAWNRTAAAGAADANRVVSIDLSGGANIVAPFFDDESFRTEWGTYGTSTYGIEGTTYRPTGVVLDMSGSVIVASANAHNENGMKNLGALVVMY